jgi:hypothetical protein
MTSSFSSALFSHSLWILLFSEMSYVIWTSYWQRNLREAALASLFSQRVVVQARAFWIG